jgi:uncharacterized protein YgiM (DUF1202 family)
MPEKLSNRGRQIIAWLVLFFLVWLIGSSFLSAISSTKLNQNPEDMKTPTSAASNSAQPSVTIQKNQPDTDGASQPPANTIGRIQVLQSGLNLRSEPNKGDNVVKTLKSGTVSLVIEKVGSWYHVWSDGDTGYVSSSPSFVKILEMKQ